MSGEVSWLAGDREFCMSDPDRLTPHGDKTFGRDTRGLILRIVVVGFHRCRNSVTARMSNSIDAF
jgi:hypothetical protein